jgi:small subunit ribosomal protein S17
MTPLRPDRRRPGRTERYMIGRRKHRSGTVVSNKMEKTVVVQVERLVKHSKYRKYLRARKKYKAHDETNACQVGDQVEIVETRPLSRDKRWAVLQIVRRAAG